MLARFDEPLAYVDAHAAHAAHGDAHDAFPVRPSGGGTDGERTQASTVSVARLDQLAALVEDGPIATGLQLGARAFRIETRRPVLLGVGLGEVLALEPERQDESRLDRTAVAGDRELANVIVADRERHRPPEVHVVERRALHVDEQERHRSGREIRNLVVPRAHALPSLEPDAGYEGCRSVEPPLL